MYNLYTILAFLTAIGLNYTLWYLFDSPRHGDSDGCYNVECNLTLKKISQILIRYINSPFLSKLPLCIENQISAALYLSSLSLNP